MWLLVTTGRSPMSLSCPLLARWLLRCWLFAILFTSSLFVGLERWAFVSLAFVKLAPRYIVHLLPFWWGEGLDFRVKGGLVTELLVRVCLKSGLGSFVGSSTFIFSPSPLGST